MLDLKITADEPMSLTVIDQDLMTLDVEEGTFFVPSDYDGGYDVTPLPFTETILQTSGKTLARDVVVEEIPYFETSNESGGYTVIIG